MSRENVRYRRQNPSVRTVRYRNRSVTVRLVVLSWVRYMALIPAWLPYHTRRRQRSSAMLHILRQRPPRNVATQAKGQPHSTKHSNRQVHTRSQEWPVICLLLLFSSLWVVVRLRHSEVSSWEPAQLERRQRKRHKALRHTLSQVRPQRKV